MAPLIKRRSLLKEEINRRMAADTAGFIDDEERRYRDEVAALADFFCEDKDGRRLVMLSGPSSSGKTTTAETLKKRLHERGVDAHSVSMDDFYRGIKHAPLREDGTRDLETIHALRLDALEQCMQEILHKGQTILPRFDFQTGSPSEITEELTVGRDAVVIFEGIHAINPIFEYHMPHERVYKLFVNTVTPVYDGAEKVLSRRDIRLTRRMLRDERFRNCPLGNTLSMWPQVVLGENEYMFPYVDTVDYLIDTTHAYEPCIFAGLLVPSLIALRENSEMYTLYKPVIERMIAALSRFDYVSPAMLPNDSMLCEFIGKQH